MLTFTFVQDSKKLLFVAEDILAAKAEKNLAEDSVHSTCPDGDTTNVANSSCVSVDSSSVGCARKEQSAEPELDSNCIIADSSNASETACLAEQLS